MERSTKMMLLSHTHTKKKKLKIEENSPFSSTPHCSSSILLLPSIFWAISYIASWVRSWDKIKHYILGTNSPLKTPIRAKFILSETTTLSGGTFLILCIAFTALSAFRFCQAHHFLQLLLFPTHNLVLKALTYHQYMDETNSHKSESWSSKKKPRSKMNGFCHWLVLRCVEGRKSLDASHNHSRKSISTRGPFSQIFLIQQLGKYLVWIIKSMQPD